MPITAIMRGSTGISFAWPLPLRLPRSGIPQSLAFEVAARLHLARWRRCRCDPRRACLRPSGCAASPPDRDNGANRRDYQRGLRIHEKIRLRTENGIIETTPGRVVFNTSADAFGSASQGLSLGSRQDDPLQTKAWLAIEPGVIEYAGVVESPSKIGIGRQCVVYHRSNNVG